MFEKENINKYQEKDMKVLIGQQYIGDNHFKITIFLNEPKEEIAKIDLIKLEERGEEKDIKSNKILFLGMKCK